MDGLTEQREMWSQHRGAPPPPDASSDEWYTPPSVFVPLDREFRFTLDPCATAESAKCARYFTKEQNGLAQPWAPERVWLQPPFSTVGDWVEKAVAEHQLCPLIVGFIPSWTDRTWWHRYIEPHRLTRGCPELRFWRGRVPFGYPGNPHGLSLGKGKRLARGFDPMVLVIWRSHV